MKFKWLISICVGLFYLQTIHAETNGLRIDIEAPQLVGRQIALCNYFEGTNYRIDSCIISSSGTGVIHRNRPLHEGLYMIYISQNKHFDFLLSQDQQFQLVIDTVNFRNNRVSGALQSEAFDEYARFLAEEQQKQTKLHSLLNELRSKNEDTQSIDQKIADQNRKVALFQQDFFAKHSSDWVGLFLKGVIPVTGPFPTPTDQTEKKDQFIYLKEHYFDPINLQDSRFWYTPILPQKVTTYMQNYVEFIPDSLANAALRLVKKTEGDSLCFRMMLSFLMNNSLQSNIVGMENIWAKLAEAYYLKKGVTTWADSTLLANIRSEYRKVRFNRIGMKAQNLLLTDTVGKEVSLYDVGKKYTLVYFFEPSCGHCKQLTPEIHDVVYPKYRDKGLEVACIYLLTDKEEWMNFIHQYQLEDWTNLWDPNRESYFWQFYDTSTTPAVFLLDENKTIIAKKLDADSLDKLLNRLTNGI